MDEAKYQGHVIIKVECQEETDKITLHAGQLLHVDTSTVLLIHQQFDTIKIDGNIPTYLPTYF